MNQTESFEKSTIISPCGQCNVGILPGGGYCDCAWGKARAGSARKKAAAARVASPTPQKYNPLDDIPFLYRKFNWATFEAENLKRGNMENIIAKGIAEAYANKGEVDGRRGLFVWGPVGSMKTGLACLVGCKLSESIGERVKYVSYYDYLGRIVENNSLQAAEAMIVDACDCPILIVDDLGFMDRERGGVIEPETPRRKEIMFRIIDQRTMYGRHTIVTSNLSGDHIMRQFGKGIESRVTGLLYNIILSGVDMRKEARHDG